jgi:hypothetical protein
MESSRQKCKRRKKKQLKFLYELRLTGSREKLLVSIHEHTHRLAKQCWELKCISEELSLPLPGAESFLRSQHVLS